jgi:hypothetical protein
MEALRNGVTGYLYSGLLVVGKPPLVLAFSAVWQGIVHLGDGLDRPIVKSLALADHLTLEAGFSRPHIAVKRGNGPLMFCGGMHG